MPSSTLFVRLSLLLSSLNIVSSFVPSGARPLRLCPLQSSPPSVDFNEERIGKALSKGVVEDDFAESDEQNVFGTLSDAITGSIFSVLHLGSDCGIKDSSKNLRVLWVRALLHNYGEVVDPVAAKLLPDKTRGLVTSEYSKGLFSPIRKFAEWIASRTTFIDESLDSFLSHTGGEPCNVVLFGSGYDTRALRYRKHPEAAFYEVDLPEVVQGKAELYEKYLRENDDGYDKEVTSRFLGKDLNEYSSGGLVADLLDLGLDPTKPTLFVWEAVLFYVNSGPKREIFKELYSFNKLPGRTKDTAVVFTDSLKPFVDVPFTSETDKFFKGLDASLLSHRSRWGGAVHFAATVLNDPSTGGLTPLGESMRGEDLVMSYTPTQSNNKKLLAEPSMDDAWYAVGYAWQVAGYSSAVEAVMARAPDGGFPTKVSSDGTTKPYATRLWNEPLVVYRDASDNLVCVTDVCPHRSAPLSMGTVEGGTLKCFYHGWAFGGGGECVDVPTQRSNPNGSEEAMAKFRDRVTDCAKRHAVAEKDGMIYVWRGELLEADASLLPSKREGDMETQPIDTVLDYAVDYSYIVENNLDSPHLFYLHDGSVPPIESIGMMSKNLPDLRLRPFQDDCGFGHLGRFKDNGRVKKLLRFDPPNVVRHGGVSGFEEEFHIVPVSPGRARVLLRQHLPKGPILSTIVSIPGMLPFLTSLVNNWNYHIALEDGAVMQGQSHLIEDMGAPRMQIGALGDDLMSRYWSWRTKAHERSGNPWRNTLQNVESKPSIPSGTTYGDDEAVVELARSTQGRIVDASETVGIKQRYVQQTPEALYPPMNSASYLQALVVDDLVKGLFQGLEPAGTMIKTEKSYAPRVRPQEAKEVDPATGVRRPEPQRIPTFAGLVAAAVTWGVVENAEVLGLREVTEKMALAMQHGLFL